MLKLNFDCNKDLAHSVETGKVILFDCPPLLFSPVNEKETKQTLARYNLPTTYARDHLPVIKGESINSMLLNNDKGRGNNKQNLARLAQAGGGREEKLDHTAEPTYDDQPREEKKPNILVQLMNMSPAQREQARRCLEERDRLRMAQENV